MASTSGEHGISTMAIHAGEGGHLPDSAPPIHISTTFTLGEPAGFSAMTMPEDCPYIYGRWGNPTVDMLSRKIAALEGTEDCTCFASGMSAATAIFLTFLSAGDHAIVSDVSYAGVVELARETLPRLGIDVSFVDMTEKVEVERAMRPNTRLVHIETPVNPIMRLTDIEAVANVVHAGHAIVSCDSTFASPIATRPAELGVDLIMHSATKYIGGHGDSIGGVVAASGEHIARLRTEASIHHGGVMSPFNAWLIARGAATLPLRMKQHERNAIILARWLESHPQVTSVLYPGIKSHPQHELAQRQMRNFSGMIAFQVGSRKTGDRLAKRFAEGLQVIHYAVSLGHHRSLIYWLPTEDLLQSSFRLGAHQAESYRAYAGDGIFRFSVGLEDPEDLIADLEQAFG